MYQIDFHKPIKMHFMGIGGISMSGLASILLKEGFTITGSDARRSELTERLEAEGIRIRYPQAAENIEDDTDLIIYTAAIHPDNPEFQEALRRNIPMLTRAQLLGEIMRNYDQSVAVAGTHGKTTTTSMLAHMTMAADMDPTVTVGGILKGIGGNIRVGSSEVFVAEACEYTNSFLSLFPKIGIILNIDADHLDFFKDLDDIRHSFRAYAQLIPANGALIIDGSIPRLEEITEGLACQVITVGHEGCDYEPRQITFDDHGFAGFDLLRRGELFGHFQLHVPGMHNVANAAAAIAACDLLGASAADMQAGLDAFTGTDRRFEYKGTYQGVEVIDDYAHHPTEIRATLEAAANHPHKTLWCVFQPHTYTRTASLLDDFAQALKLADRVLLADIYAAREVNTIGISSDDLRKKIEEAGGQALYLDSFEKIEDYLREHLSTGDLLITMGAGDVYTVGEDLLST